MKYEMILLTIIPTIIILIPQNIPITIVGAVGNRHRQLKGVAISAHKVVATCF